VVAVKPLWFNKSRRAQNPDDYETWIEGGVVPTLNAFDNGDIRATTVIVVRMREGKPGGGKGPLMSEDRSLTLATANDQTLFVFYGNRVNDVRIQDDKINTLQARMGTGGNNMPMVADTQVRRLTPLECERLQGFPDNWTEGQTDTHRYKQMGNAVAVPVVEWLMDGIVNQ
jgi:site-specific DNA-cytosine methylase